MSYLDAILNVQVSAQVRALRQRGFGKPMFLAVHSFWTDLARDFGDESELTAAGVPATHPIMLAFRAFKAQEPTAPLITIGRRTRPFTQVKDITPATPENGKKYSITIDGVIVDHVANGSSTVDSVIDALIVDAGTIPDLTLVGNPVGTSTKIVATGTTAGVLHSFTDLVGLSIKDVTANPGSGGVAADFAAVLAANDSWYGVVLDSQSKAEIEALAPAIEAAKKEFAYTSADSEILAGTSGNVALTMQTAGYARSIGTYHPKPQQYFAAALLGRQMPKQPGSTNWAWQAALAGVDYATLTAAQLTTLDAANFNHYTDFAGQGYGVYLYGKSSVGTKIDVTNFSDWMRVRMQERLFLLFINAEKIGATSIGIQLIANEMRAQFSEGVRVGGLDPDFETVLDIPDISEIPLADVAANKASGFRARHRLAVAFDKVDPMIFTLTL